MLRTDSRHGSDWLGDIAAAAVLAISLIMLLLLAPAMARAKTLKAADVSFPADTPCVSDNAGLLDEEVKQSVTDLNAKWEKKAAGAQLAVVTVDSLPADESIEDYSMELAEHIKPGQKGKDNGLLYLIVKDTHQDRLEVGYGLESKVTDAQASEVLDDAHGYFKQGDYPSGVKAVLKDLDTLVLGTGKADSVSGEGESVSDDIYDWFLIIVFIICPIGFLACWLISSIRERLQWSKEDATMAEQVRAYLAADEDDAIECTPTVLADVGSNREGKRRRIVVVSHRDDYDEDDDNDDDDFWSSSSSWHSSSHSSSSSHFGGFGGGSFGGGGASGSW